MASLIRDVWFLLSALLRWMKQEVGSLLQCGRNPVDAAVAQAAKHAGFHVLIIGAGTVLAFVRPLASDFVHDFE
jgi:hypothetical protein